MEVRWFTEGNLPRSVLDWFQCSDSEPEVQPARLDYYFPIAGVTTLGVKLREGRVELKQRERRLGIIRLHEQVHGALERWCKWSFGLAETPTSLAAMGVPGPGWVGVEKKRVVRRYGVNDGGLRAVRQGEYPLRGCAWELTEITISGSEWWSLGLETFGGDHGLQEILIQVAQRLLVEHRLPTLAAEDSFGYPELLAMLGRRIHQPRA